MSNSIFYKADTRGKTNIDWLSSFHTFSFGDYHEPTRNSFGLLRVLNDDTVKPSSGFDQHSHQNMEIMTIPLRGSLFHQDHLGNRSTIKKGEVQIMSAGTGIMHSEHNPSNSEDVNFFQIWCFPKQKQILPRYGQKLFDVALRKNNFQCVISPDEREGSLWINQDTFVYLSNIDEGKTLHYKLNDSTHGVLAMLIEGQVKIEAQVLEHRDAIGISAAREISIQAVKNSELVLFEVPMA